MSNKIRITSKMVAEATVKYLHKHKIRHEDMYWGIPEDIYWELMEQHNGKGSIDKFLPFLDSQLPKMTESRLDLIYDLIQKMY